MATTAAEPSTPAAVQAAQWRPKHNPWLVALTVTLATFMEVLDTSIANVALPKIAGTLGAGQDESTWVLTSYLVANAIVLPLSAWFSTIFGRKRFYIGCVILFTVSSLLCGLATSLGMLILFRILQGIGGGGLQPSEQAILRDTFPPGQSAMAFAVYGIAVVTAPAIGPTLGGWITDNYNWHWIFFINVPVGILSVFLSSRMVEDPPHVVAQQKAQRANLKIDWIGLLLISLGLGLLQLMLDKGEREDWFESSFILFCAVVSGVSLVLAVWWELRVKQPVVDLKLLKDRNFATAFGLMFMLGFVLLGSTVLLPLFVQTLYSYTAQQAGAVISPGGFLIMVLMPLVGFLLGRVQARYMVAIGLTITSLALWHMTGFNLQMDYWHIAQARMLQAAGLAFLFVPINAAAYVSVPREKNNNASALINLARNMGGSFGIAFVATYLAQRTQFHQSRMVEHLTPGDPQYESALRQMSRVFEGASGSAADAQQQAYAFLYRLVNQQAALQAFLDNFWILAVAFGLLVPIVFLMRPNKPGSGPASAH